MIKRQIAWVLDNLRSDVHHIVGISKELFLLPRNSTVQNQELLEVVLQVLLGWSYLTKLFVFNFHLAMGTRVWRHAALTWLTVLMAHIGFWALICIKSQKNWTFHAQPCEFSSVLQVALNKLISHFSLILNYGLILNTSLAHVQSILIIPIVLDMIHILLLFVLWVLYEVHSVLAIFVRVGFCSVLVSADVMLLLLLLLLVLLLMNSHALGTHTV